MVDLIVRQLKRTHPALIPTEDRPVDAVRHANLPAEYKRDILSYVWREAGPETLLSAGQGIRDVEYDPIWHAAVRSSSPILFFDKWERFEVFAHSRNRVQIGQIHERGASFHRYTVDGGKPTPPEDLLVCGLIIALLEEIGCDGLHCDMPLSDGTIHRIREHRKFSVPNDGRKLATTDWSIEWQAFSPRVHKPPLEAALAYIALPKPCDLILGTSIQTVVGILMLDVARQWTVGELAQVAGLSTRSLQRKLSEADLSFSRLVRLVRIHEACRLLQDSAATITEIGFCAGFSDSAHFSRDFRASTGMTPSDYRTILLSQPKTSSGPTSGPNKGNRREKVGDNPS